jgi:hypothetical protein
MKGETGCLFSLLSSFIFHISSFPWKESCIPSIETSYHETFAMKRFSGTAIAVTLGLLAIATAAAQPRDAKSEMDRASAEFFEMLRVWARKDVLPQFRAWKSTLDSAMTAEDLATLNALRARLAPIRKEAVAKAEMLNKAWSEKQLLLEEERDKMKGYRAARNVVLKELKPLTVKYPSTLEAIGVEAKPKIKAWEKKAEEMIERWARSRKERDKITAQILPNLHLEEFVDIGDLKNRFTISRFMLWDGGDDLMDHVLYFAGVDRKDLD